MRGPKRYFGYRDADGIATVVYLTHGGTWASLRLDPKRTPIKSLGWEWGYGGSGPSELARHLLAHATGRRDFLDRPDLYQRFKEQTVARFDRETPWTLAADAIREWVRQAETANPDGADTAWATAESPRADPIDQSWRPPLPLRAVPRYEDAPDYTTDDLADDDAPDDGDPRGRADPDSWARKAGGLSDA